MTAGATRVRPVTVVDLITDQVLAESWLRWTRDGEGFEVSDRVVIVDRTTSLARNFGKYEHLYVSGHHIVCVVVGPAEDTDSDPVLKLPGQLSQDGAAVLWVGDENGIWWSPDHSRGGQSRPTTGRSGLDELKHVLSIDDVFDDVVAAARRIPHATANPGLHVVSGSVEPAELGATRSQVIARLTAPAGPDAAQVRFALPGTDPADAGDEDGPPSIAAGSELDVVRTIAIEESEHADTVVEQFAGWTGLLGTGERFDVRGEIAAAGRHLDEFSSLVRRTANAAGASVRSGRPAVDKLGALGLALPVKVEPGDVADELRAAVRGQLASGRSLVELATALRGAATRLTPGATTRVEADLDRQYPSELSRRLASPPTFPRWPIPPGTLPVIAFATAAGSLLPGWYWLAGVLLGVCWVGAVIRAAISRPAAPGESTVLAALPVLAHTLAAAAGVAAARWGVPRWGWSIPVEVTALLALVATVVLAVLLPATWRRGVERWHADVATADARTAAAGIGGVLEWLAQQEWRLANRRQFTSDAMRAMAEAMDEVVAMLSAIAVAQPDGDGGRVVENPLLSAVVVDDLVDLALEALEPCWVSMATGQRLDDLASGVDGRVRTLFEEYRTHLDKHGVHEVPPFGHPTERREKLIAETLRQVPEILAVTRRTGHEGMRQLCAARDLLQLNRASADIQVVRFAPTLAQPRLDSSTRQQAEAFDIRWTSSTLAAGIVRLVPLRTDVIHPFWPRDEEAAR